jgi:hypothetical protein
MTGDPEPVRGPFWQKLRPGHVLLPAAGPIPDTAHRPEARVCAARGRRWHGQEQRIASRIGGALLFALAAYVVVAAGWDLWTRQDKISRGRACWSASRRDNGAPGLAADVRHRLLCRL